MMIARTMSLTSTQNNLFHFDFWLIFTLIFEWYLRYFFQCSLSWANWASFIIESERFHFIMLTEWQVSPTVTLHGAGDKSPLLRGLGKVDAWDGEEVLDGDEPPVHLGSLLSTDTASRLTLDSPTYKQTHKVSLHHRHRQNRHVWNSRSLLR